MYVYFILLLIHHCYIMCSTCNNNIGCWRLDDHLSISFYMESKETVRFNLTNTDHSWDTNAYFAVGISRDTLMGEDDVISCLIDEKLNMKVQHSFNEGKPRRGNVPIIGSSSLLDVDKGHRLSDQEDGNPRSSPLYAYSCAFSRPFKFTENFKSFDLLNEQYYLIAAVGKIRTFNSGSLEKHHSHFISSSKVNLSADSQLLIETASQSKAGRGLIAAHGIFQIVAWGILAPISLFTVKFYRPYFQYSLVVQKQKWFVLHATLNWATFFCCVLAIFFALFHKNFRFQTSAHSVFGLVVFFTLMSQLLMGLLRPDLGSKWRSVFNWCHRVCGTALVTLGLITAFLGLKEYTHLFSDDKALTHFLVVLLALCILAHIFFVWAFTKKVSGVQNSTLLSVNDPNITDDVDGSCGLGNKLVVDSVDPAGFQGSNNNNNDPTREGVNQSAVDVAMERQRERTADLLMTEQEYQFATGKAPEDVNAMHYISGADISRDIEIAIKRKVMIKVHYSFCVVVILVSIVIAFDLLFSVSGRQWS